MNTDPATYARETLMPYRSAAQMVGDDEAVDLLDYGEVAYVEDSGGEKPLCTHSSPIKTGVIMFIVGAIFGQLLSGVPVVLRRSPRRETPVLAIVA